MKTYSIQSVEIPIPKDGVVVQLDEDEVLEVEMDVGCWKSKLEWIAVGGPYRTRFRITKDSK